MSEVTPNTRPIPAKEESQRLPKSLKPIHYDLTFEPDLDGATSYQGSTIIDIKVLQDTNSVTVNALDLEFSLLEVGLSNGDPIANTSVHHDTKKQRVTITLGETVKAGSEIYLKSNFKGSLLHPTHGFYRAPVQGKDDKKPWIAVTQMEPASARKVFPCFDEPALKATFRVTLVAEKHMTCLANMDVASETDVSTDGKQKKAVLFNKTPPMSTYIVAFAVGELQMIETNTFKVPVRVYAAIDKNIQHGRYGLELASRTLRTFEKIFDIDFPLPKMDLIAVPGGQGAMENWGLVTFGESLLLVDEKETSAAAYRTAGSVIVHELAHQWFGNIVTMDFWEGLWLNESFADWAELYAWETLEPDWQMWQDYATNGLQAGLLLDSNKASHPIEVPVRNVSQINQIFDDISYNKGCAVIRMIASHLGTDTFIEGVRYYLKKHAYGNTKTSDLWDALSHVSGQDVGYLMETWTKYIGYPFVTVTESPPTSNDDQLEITVTQHRFLQDGTLSPSDDQILYPLSLNIWTPSGIDNTITLHERSKTFTLPSKTYKLNTNHTSFYRTLYTPSRLAILGENLKAGLLSVNDRIGLLSDTLALCSASHIPISHLLSFLQSFKSEKNYFVWKQIVKTFSEITDAFTFESESITEGLNKFKRDLMKTCAEDVGWEFKEGDGTVECMLKGLMFANSGAEEGVKGEARRLWDLWKNGEEGGGDGREDMDVNVRAAVFGIVVEGGGDEEYNTILSALLSPPTTSSPTTSIYKRDTLTKSLGCSQSPHLIARTLSLALSPEFLARNDTRNILFPLMKHRKGKEALWEWFKGTFVEIERALGNSLGKYARLVKMVSGGLSTKAQWEDVNNFFEDKDTQAYDKYLAQSMNTILARATWVERDRENMVEWLKMHGYA